MNQNLKNIIWSTNQYIHHGYSSRINAKVSLMSLVDVFRSFINVSVFVQYLLQLYITSEVYACWAVGYEGHKPPTLPFNYALD